MPQQVRPTVLITINTSWNIVNFRASLIEALAQAGYDIMTAAPQDDYTSALRQMVKAHYNLPMQNDGTSIWQDAKLFWRYYRLLGQVKPYVVLAYTIKPNVYATLAAAAHGIPVINNVSGLGTVFIKQNWLTRIARLLYRAAFCFSSCVFFQNPSDRQLFIDLKLVPEGKAALLPGSGIDLSLFSAPSAIAVKEACEPCDFVLIARMLRDKGIGEYVEAARMVKQKHPLCRFRLVGPLGVQNKTAIDAVTMQQWVNEGVVEYMGESTDVRPIMSQHDCVVLPSYREGLSRVLLEASAMGRPMIATNVPGCRDVVSHGDNGFLCEPYSAESLAEQMLAFIALTALQKKQMAQRSRSIAEEKFDHQLVHAAYLTQLSHCLKKVPA